MVASILCEGANFPDRLFGLSRLGTTYCFGIHFRLFAGFEQREWCVSLALF